VLKLVIAPTGEVLSCDVVSSELNNPDLKAKLRRIKLIRFPAQDVERSLSRIPLSSSPPADCRSAGPEKRCVLAPRTRLAVSTPAPTIFQLPHLIRAFANNQARLSAPHGEGLCPAALCYRLTPT
jgi:hypothetical protein